VRGRDVRPVGCHVGDRLGGVEPRGRRRAELDRQRQRAAEPVAPALRARVRAHTGDRPDRMGGEGGADGRVRPGRLVEAAPLTAAPDPVSGIVRAMRILHVLVIASALAVLAMGCGKKAGGSGKPKIAVSIFPIWDVTRRIAGDRLDVLLVLPAGKSEHGYD